MGDRVTIEGVLDSFIWHRDDNPWGVALFDDGSSMHKVVGEVAHCVPGKSYRVEGFAVEDRYGRSVKVASIVAVQPRGSDAVQSYLETLPGIGPTTAIALVQAYGPEDVIRALREDPLEEVREKAGIRVPVSKLHDARLAVGEENAALEVELQVRDMLGSLGTDKLVKLVLKKWGKKAPDRIQANPWSLATLPRIGFHRADAVAQHLGVDPKSPDRIKAALRHVVGELRNNGHTRLHKVTMAERANEVLDYGPEMDMQDAVASQIGVLCADGELVNLEGTDYVQLAVDHRCEIEVASRLARRMTWAPTIDRQPLHDPGPPFGGGNLYDDQAAALKMMIGERQGGTCLLTGPPGTGKTTMIRAFLPHFRINEIALCAPTGKAARRLQEQAGRKASTIHMLLEPVPLRAAKDDVARGVKEGDTVFGFNRNHENQIDYDLVVVDEVSMVDVHLFRSLLRAIPDECYLLLVGDQNQLPSVGVGSVLRDLIECGEIPHAHLHQIKRTNPGMLLSAIHNVKDGVWNPIKNGKDQDLFVIPARDDAHAVERMADLYLDRLPAMLGYEANPIMDIQLLVPWKSKEGLSAKTVNEEVQRRRALAGEVALGKFDLGVGDKVIQTRNDYEVGVVNGDVGVITDMQKIGSEWTYVVQFVGYERPHEIRAIGNNLELAYAVTVHKCVAPGTIVETNLGMFRIEHIIESGGLIGTSEGPRAFQDGVQNPAGPAITITTERGYQVTATPDHKFMAWTGKSYEMVECQDIRPGQFMRMSKRTSVEPDGYIEDLIEYAVGIHPDPRCKDVHLPRVLDEDVGLWMGLMVADGTVFQRGMRLAKRHRDVVEKWAELTSNIFGIEVAVQSMGNFWLAELHSTAVAEWCREVGGMSPHEKMVPEPIMQSPISVHQSFLCGLFEDGSVALNRGNGIDHVEWSTCVEEMSRIVQIMLLRIGIPCSRAKYGASWRISIYGNAIDTFREKIGFIAAAKNERLWLPHSSDSRERIPVAKHEVSNEIGPMRNAKARGYVSRDFAMENGLAVDRVDFLHDRVKDVVPTTSESYCVAVPSLGRFNQNGFDGSNCQGSEFPIIVLPAMGTSSPFYDRPLFYTALSRAQQAAVLVGRQDGLDRVVARTSAETRRTNLQTCIFLALQQHASAEAESRE